MATNWKTLTGTDIRKVLSISVMRDADQDTTAAANPDNDLDEALLTNRSNVEVGFIVQEIRGAIANGGRSSLSLTAASIPPECERYALVMAAYNLIVSTPGLKMFIMTDHGPSSPFTQLYNEARTWLKAVWEGRQQVGEASDPDPDIQPNAVRWGDCLGTDSDGDGKAGKIDMSLN